VVNYRFVYLDYNRAWLNGIQNAHDIKIHSVFIRTILIALVFLFATIFANFSFTVVAYQYDTRSNSSGNLYGSSLAVGSSEHDNKLLTLHNITNEVSFAGEVNARNLPNLPPSKPSVIIDPKEQYLTRNYTAYISAKKHAELVRPANKHTTNVTEIQRPDLPLLVPNFNSETKNKNNANNSFVTINILLLILFQVF
jgi:hypothetical protein